MRDIPPELAGLSEAEDFFETLGVPFLPAVLDRHRLQIMKVFGLATESWLEANPTAAPSARREAIGGALREAHAAFAEGPPVVGRSPFGAPRLVTIGRRE